MTLHIVALDQPRKSAHRVPRGGWLESAAPVKASPKFCACANRYGAGLAAINGSANQAWASRSGAVFARLGR
jgi:hypothetical protein